MNMRKIIAVLAAVLMLCAAIPMGALSVTAATGDVAVDWNFDDGVAHFERGTAENGYMVFDATTADWQCAYQYIGTINSDTTYKVTFKAMANKDAELTFKIQNDWAPAHVAETVDVTTEWQEYELIVNSGTVNPPIVLFASGYTAANAPIYYIDDLKIVEIVDPALIGKVVNGDFSDNSGWTLGNGATIADGVLKLENPNAWGEAAMQTVPVKANTNYEITWKSQRISGSGAFYMTTMDASFANMQVTSGQSWMNNPSTDWLDHSITLNTGASEVIILKLTAEVDNAGAILLDDITIKEMKDPSFDGYITNGDFETGKKSPWNLYQSTVISADAAHTGDYGVHIVGVGNWGGLLEQDISGLVVGNEYVFSFWMKMNHQGVNVKIGDSYVGWFTSVGDWTLVTHKFTATATTAKILINGGGDGNPNPDLAADLYVDDFSIAEAIEPSDDGYIKNGNFEAGSLSPWQKIWDTQVAASIIDDGHDSPFGAKVTGKAPWGQLRQLINVEPNTDYKVTLWAKDVNNMALLVKDGGDTANILNTGINAGADWTEITAEFNSGDNTTVYLGVMVNDAASYGTFDDFKVEKIVCEHEYDDCLDADCNLCGETREPGHNLTYFEAVVATNCQETGHAEYWYCENCGCYFGDAEATWQHNPGWLFTTGDCVRPEGAADCATVPCELCGNDIYGYGEHDTGVPACQDGHCSKCDQAVTGYGHQNYDGPACLPGNCYYCGEAMEPVAHENGAWAPCLEGECSYGCGLTYPATAEHVNEDGNYNCDVCWSVLPHDCIDEDANGECDICYNTMPHDCIDEDGDHHCDICWGVMPHDCIDEDANGECDICWNPMPEEPPVVEIIYGDTDGDGEVTMFDSSLLSQYLSGYDVTLDEAAADTDGDGEVTMFDSSLLSQYLSGYDVTMGPQG
ncbi:MAG: carbohydrate binding domain-containing protein [Clostridia bacterium]|nr:carbohydrate binding domain-containing protein [Clostridia bacterium]